ncbi:FAD-binding oxidoreductase [Microbacterium sp. YJN-G]|uniref:FAD-binding oxidoreductase n=1 Tax=Microbacterium sp. YJN-G TaxID=2763257 RepID=UPI001877679A|nr:FAD-binding protein [Microbacterium sp. YJN-G]
MDSTNTTRPKTAEDVAALVGQAQAGGQPVTVIGGGHGPWSRGPEEGVRIDLSALDRIDVAGPLVSVGGGATWGVVADELAQHGLAISSGDTRSVGVGGLTLGGGIGWMVRAWGLAADQLVGAQIVTATGGIVETSATEHPELFWALHGGGGNLGIVTRFDFQAHALPGIAYGE